MTPKKVPLRRCAGCGESKPKRELLRVVRSPEGEISLDLTGRKNGRGVYLCPKADCFRKARKANRLAHALEAEIPEETLNALETEIAAAEKLTPNGDTQ